MKETNIKSSNKMIELSLRVGSDKSVDKTCNGQTLLSENDEVVSPNLQRGVATDPQLKPTNFIKPKKILNISTSDPEEKTERSPS